MTADASGQERSLWPWVMGVFIVAFIVARAATAAAQAVTPANTAVWDSLRPDVFGEKAIEDAAGLIVIEAPQRAEDAAIVPIDLHFNATQETGRIKAVTLIVDENPSPVAATFTFGRDAGVTHLATRLRVNSYSYVRAIAETEDGRLRMTQTFVKASGGCSAPAMKNPDQAQAELGRMKLRVFAAQPAVAPAPMTRPAEVQLMIRHPNNSGLQMDQVTRYYIPARFVHALSISQGKRPIMTMEGGISISEDPNFRFEFNAVPGQEIKVEAVDTDGKVFKDAWPVEPEAL